MNAPCNKSSSLAYEIAFYERLLKEDPHFIDALVPLADAYTKIGEYKKGLEIDKRLAQLKSTDATVFYNLACSYALLNMVDESFTALSKAVTLGWRDREHIQQDADLTNIRTDSRFQALIDRMGENRKKKSH